jgi:hypothetical protein
MMTWLLVATGFTGAFTLRFLYRQLLLSFVAPPSVEVRITNGADSLDGLLGALKRARREILVLARSLAAPPVARALVEAKLRNVTVEILVDPACERDRTSDLAFLLEQGLQPLVAEPDAVGMDAVVIIDGRTVYCGGFSSPEEPGDDTSADMLCIKGHPSVAAGYRLHFANEKSGARPVQVKAQAGQATASKMYTTPVTPQAAPAQRTPTPAPAGPVVVGPVITRPAAAAPAEAGGRK